MQTLAPGCPDTHGTSLAESSPESSSGGSSLASRLTHPCLLSQDRQHRHSSSLQFQQFQPSGLLQEDDKKHQSV
ncbi:hypothetical protein Y1Q_0003313 [Alligator mississippiensis]|uniref:Uncharacterized protein n=1 Tax=Alligator mississippiensis TaxID=8496 RepID=A0A151MEA5_ALLMI|nr:hypothetical protein Y1Q_0003313 [Alligator mississippiensis]